MKRTVHYLAALLLFSGYVGASEISSNQPSVLNLDDYAETGAELSGIRAPYYDDEGNLRAQVFSGRARILEGNMADVSNIRIDVYKEGVVIMTLYAPQCFTQILEKGDENILYVESDGDVLIEMEQMKIAGKGFRFTSDSNRFEIVSEARVLVKDTTKNVEALEL